MIPLFPLSLNTCIDTVKLKLQTPSWGGVRCIFCLNFYSSLDTFIAVPWIEVRCLRPSDIVSLKGFLLAVWTLMKMKMTLFTLLKLFWFCWHKSLKKKKRHYQCLHITKCRVFNLKTIEYWLIHSLVAYSFCCVLLSERRANTVCQFPS